MPITNDKDLPQNVRTLWLKAMSAVELRNYGYAISLIHAVLKDSPGFLDGRKVLRSAEIANTKGKKRFLSGLSTASLKGAGMVKKDPLAAMELAEKTLESDPFNRQANDLLKEAARAAHYPGDRRLCARDAGRGEPQGYQTAARAGGAIQRAG